MSSVVAMRQRLGMVKLRRKLVTKGIVRRRMILIRKIWIVRNIIRGHPWIYYIREEYSASAGTKGVPGGE